jgi:hypothetical protein
MIPYKENEQEIKLKYQLNMLKEREKETDTKYQELKKVKKNLDKLSLTNDLVKENINLSKNIYKKLDKDNKSFFGSNFINLHDVLNYKSSQNENEIEQEGIDKNNEIQKYSRKGSDSDLSDMDINVETIV